MWCWSGLICHLSQKQATLCNHKFSWSHNFLYCPSGFLWVKTPAFPELQDKESPIYNRDIAVWKELWGENWCFALLMFIYSKVFTSPTFSELDTFVKGHLPWPQVTCLIRTVKCPFVLTFLKQGSILVDYIARDYRIIYINVHKPKLRLCHLHIE